MDLDNVDVNIEDKDQTLLLLCSLPPSFKNFRKTLIYEKDFISLEDVKKSLLSKELIHRELTRERDVKSEALFTRGRLEEKRSNCSKNRSRSKSKARSKFCNYCKKKGHIF